jgi:transcriptional regulator with XRE-family HTH domain
MPLLLAFVNLNLETRCILLVMSNQPNIESTSVIDSSHEAMGQRIARLRKALGMTQQGLAEKIGINRTMVTEYEAGRIRIYDEMIASLARALNTTADDILGLKHNQAEKPNVDLKIMKRLKKIESLPPFEQKTLLKTIDMYLKGANSDKTIDTES